MRIFLLGLLLVPAFASAQSSPSFDYFGVGFASAEYDAPGIDADGWGIEGSFSVRENLYFSGSYVTTDIEIAAGTIDTDVFTIGGGLKVDVAEGLALYGGLGALRYDFGAFDDTGIYMEGGIRYAISEHYEVRAGATHADIDGVDIDPVFSIAGDIHLTEVFAVNVGVSFEEDIRTYGVGFRLYFDRDTRR